LSQFGRLERGKTIQYKQKAQNATIGIKIKALDIAREVWRNENGDTRRFACPEGPATTATPSSFKNLCWSSTGDTSIL